MEQYKVRQATIPGLEEINKQQTEQTEIINEVLNYDEILELTRRNP